MLSETDIKEEIKELKHSIKIKDYDDDVEKWIFKGMISAYESVIEADDEKYWVS